MMNAENNNAKSFPIKIESIDDSVLNSDEQWQFFLEQNLMEFRSQKIISKRISHWKTQLLSNIQFSREYINSFRDEPLIMIVDISNLSTIPLIFIDSNLSLDKGIIPKSMEEIQILTQNCVPDTLITPSPNMWHKVDRKKNPNIMNLTLEPDNSDINKKHNLNIYLSHQIIGSARLIRLFIPLYCHKLLIGHIRFNIAFLIKQDTTPDRITLETGPFELPVLHNRKKCVRGKDVKVLKKEHSYEITLFIVNQGNQDLDNVIIQDTVPNFFLLSEFSHIPKKIYRFSSFHRIIWYITSIKVEEKVEIKYIIEGIGVYNASEAQFSI